MGYFEWPEGGLVIVAHDRNSIVCFLNIGSQKKNYFLISNSLNLETKNNTFKVYRYGCKYSCSSSFRRARKKSYHYQAVEFFIPDVCVADAQKYL